MAPEIFEDPPVYSKAGDVYAFGVLMNEVLIEGIPLKGSTHAQIIAHIVVRRKRPRLFTCPLGDGVLSELRELVEHCWNQDRSLRPSFAHISSVLDRCYRSIGEMPSTMPRQRRLTARSQSETYSKHVFHARVIHTDAFPS
jgi:serine/threonine protein kinase